MQLFIIAFFQLTILSAYAQVVSPKNAATTLENKLSAYYIENPSPNLYLHLDKNTYNPDEVIWFKAYLLSDTSTAGKVLYVRLVNEKKEIISTNQFPMYDIRAHGDIQIYKTLPEGKYMLYAYTDEMISHGDTNVFVQPIRIRQSIGKKLEAEAMVTDTTKLIRGEKVQLLAKVKASGRMAKNIKGEYELVAGGKVIKDGGLRTNEFGEAFINFTYPNLPDDQSLQVNMVFNGSNDYAELSLNLTHEGNPLKVNIYPEGGHLIQDVPNRVAIQILDIFQNPVSTEIQVKDNGKVIAETRTGKHGIALINVKSKSTSRYTIEVTTKKGWHTVDFPLSMEPNGYGLKVQNNKDGLEAIVHNRGVKGDAMLALRSKGTILWTKLLRINPGDSAKFQVPAENFSKNIISLAIFDQNNNVQAERYFFNKEKEDYNVSIHTNEQDYGMRKKVTVKLRVTDIHDNPIIANLSVAAVEKKRIDTAVYKTILDVYHYKQKPSNKIKESLLESDKSLTHLNEILLTMQWNPSWKSILTYEVGKKKILQDTDGVFGKVIPLQKKQKPKEIFIQSPATISLAEIDSLDFTKLTRRVAIKLDENNLFSLPSSVLISEKGKDWLLGLGKEPTYQVEWKDPDIEFDSTIISGSALILPEKFSTVASYKITAASRFSFQEANLLEEVVIGGKELTRPKRLGCQDWVCPYNVLNCSNHPTGTKPIRGKTYNYQPNVDVIYLGCGAVRNIAYIKNITIPEWFHLPDYETDPTLNEDNRSTIFWAPNLVTEADGTATFSFFTSDLTGEYKIIAQGLDVNTLNPLKGTGTFKVVPN